MFSLQQCGCIILVSRRHSLAAVNALTVSLKAEHNRGEKKIVKHDLTHHIYSRYSLTQPSLQRDSFVSLQRSCGHDDNFVTIVRSHRSSAHNTVVSRHTVDVITAEGQHLLAAPRRSESGNAWAGGLAGACRWRRARVGTKKKRFGASWCFFNCWLHRGHMKNVGRE